MEQEQDKLVDNEVEVEVETNNEKPQGVDMVGELRAELSTLIKSEVANMLSSVMEGVTQTPQEPQKQEIEQEKEIKWF